MKKKVLVVDLDGTLYSINTFHYFIKYLVWFCVKNLDIVLLIKILVTIICRRFKFISHAKMKYAILKAIANKTGIDYQKFVKNISIHKISIPLIKDNSFDIKMLATAAPFCYANIISENENFDLCIATNFPSEKFNNTFENSKEVKKNNLMNHLSTVNIYEIDTLITDHIDDVSLMELARKNLIVNPSNFLKTELKQRNISFETFS